MKTKITLTICCFSICLPIIAQNYFPLIEENKTWDIFYWQGGIITPYDAGERQYLDGDTLIDGKLYKVIWANPLVALEEPVFAEPFGLSDQSYKVGFIREDTLTRKVYSRGGNNADEYLTYDFNLQIGDSLLLAYLDSTFIRVDTIQEITTLNGKVRKRFLFRGDYLLDENNFYVEGIGGASTLLFPFDYSFEFGADIRCVQKNNIPIYDSGACDLVVNSEEIDIEKRITVFPNPTKGSLGITGLRGRNVIRLMDVTGKLCKTFTSHISTEEIDISRFSAGLYFLSVFEEQSKSIKIIRLIKR